MVDVRSANGHATLIGHLALSPLHCVIPDTGPHLDPRGAAAVLQTLDGGERLLVGPLWPTPGAARWSGSGIRAAVPDPVR